MTDDTLDEWRELYTGLTTEDAEELAEFIVRAEAGEYDDIHVDETVRVARSLLDKSDTDTIDAVLARWDPESIAVGEYTARAQTRRAVEWLRESDAAHGRRAFADALADETTLNTDTWWTSAVRPGLDRFVAVGVVALEALGTYRWVGDASGPDRDRGRA